MVKHLPTIQETWVQSLGWEDPLEKEMATHWKIPWMEEPGSLQSMEISGQNTRVGSLSLFQGIFPTQGLNPGLLHYRQILYQLSHKGSPRILEWVVIPSSADIPNPGIELGSPPLQADSLPAEL